MSPVEAMFALWWVQWAIYIVTLSAVDGEFTVGDLYAMAFAPIIGPAICIKRFVDIEKLKRDKDAGYARCIVCGGKTRKQVSVDGADLNKGEILMDVHDDCWSLIRNQVLKDEAR